MKTKIPYGYIYRIKNLTNGKTYIGQRKLSKDKKWREYMGSGLAILRSIEKYGKNNFIKQFICYAQNAEELSKLEYNYIKAEKLAGKCEYNIALFTPPPSNTERYNNQSEEYKRNTLKRLEKARIKRQEKRVLDQDNEYIYFINKYSAKDIIDIYKKHKTIKNSAQYIGTSAKIFRRLLIDNHIPIIKRNEKYHTQSEETKKKISDSLKISLNEKTIKYIIEKTKKGVPISKIAKSLDINVGIVKRILNEQNINNRDYKKRYNWDTEKAIQLRNMGFSFNKISKEVGVSSVAVFNYFKNNPLLFY